MSCPHKSRPFGLYCPAAAALKVRAFSDSLRASDDQDAAWEARVAAHRTEPDHQAETDAFLASLPTTDPDRTTLKNRLG